MPWVAPIVGYIDRRGNLRCSACADEGEHEVPGDQWFGADDKCCECGKQLEHVRTKDYIHVS